MPTAVLTGVGGDGQVGPADLSLDDIKALTDTHSIHALLKQLNQQEQHVDHELDELLEQRDRLQQSMASLMLLKYVLWSFQCGL